MCPVSNVISISFILCFQNKVIGNGYLSLLTAQQQIIKAVGRREGLNGGVSFQNPGWPQTGNPPASASTPRFKTAKWDCVQASGSWEVSPWTHEHMNTWTQRDGNTPWSLSQILYGSLSDCDGLLQADRAQQTEDLAPPTSPAGKKIMYPQIQSFSFVLCLSSSAVVFISFLECGTSHVTSVQGPHWSNCSGFRGCAANSSTDWPFFNWGEM